MSLSMSLAYIWNRVADPLGARISSWEPPKVFGWLALFLIGITLVATSITLSAFMGRSLIDSESRIVGDMVNILAGRELTTADLDGFADPEVETRFRRSFDAIKNLSGEVRIKVFRPDGVIVWSDEPHLIGTQLTMHRANVSRALEGEKIAVFDPPERALWNPKEDLPRTQLIEFYVPLYLGGPQGIGANPSAVLALYRLPEDINWTIDHALILLWAVTGAGGIIMYLTLVKLVRTIYDRQRKAEREFAELSQEHQRVVQIEKLSAVGQAVSEIAHQINNPLVGVVNLAELAEREISNPKRVRELLAEIRSAGDHCRGFVKRMLGFSQVAHCQPERIDLRQLVYDVANLFERSGTDGHIQVKLPEEELILDIDPVLVRHALFNLIQNALQACPEGPVGVSAWASDGDEPRQCSLSISDRGPGISPEVAAKIFSPFFTTRPGGTGLGLPIVKLVTMWHGGQIRAENNPDGGARFVMTLPMRKTP